MSSKKVDALVTIKRSGALGLRYEFDERTWCSIGAHADCDIRIHAEKVAVLHALVSILEDGPLIYGLDKDFPVEIPDRQISLSDSRFAPLHHGDVFFVGERAFRFEAANGPTLPTPAVSKSLSRTSGHDVELELPNENIPPAHIEAVSKKKKKSRKSLLITDNGEKVVAGPKRASIIHKSRLSLPASKIVHQLVLDNELNRPVKYSAAQPKPRKSIPVFQSSMGEINVNYGQPASASCVTAVLGEKRKKEVEAASTPIPKQPKDAAAKTPETKPISALNFYSKTPTKTPIKLSSNTPTNAVISTPKITPAVTPTKKPSTLLPKTPPTTPAPIPLSAQQQLPRPPITAQGHAEKSKSPAFAATTIAPAQVNPLRSRPALTPMKAGASVKSIGQGHGGATPRSVGGMTPRMPQNATPRTLGEMTPRMTQKSSEGFSLSSSFPSPFAGPRNQGTPIGRAAQSAPVQARLQGANILGMSAPRQAANFAGTPTRNLGTPRRVPIFERGSTTPASTRDTARLTPRRVPLSERRAMPLTAASTPGRAPFAERLKTPSSSAAGGDQRRNLSALTPRRNASALTPRRVANPGGAPPSTPTRKQVGTPRRVVADPTALRPSITKPNSGLSRLPPRTPKRMRVETSFTPSISGEPVAVPAFAAPEQPIEVNAVISARRMDPEILEKAQKSESPARIEAADKSGSSKTPVSVTKPDRPSAAYPVEEDKVLFDSAPLENTSSAKPGSVDMVAPSDKPSLIAGSALSETEADGQESTAFMKNYKTAEKVSGVKTSVADEDVRSSPDTEATFTPRRSPRMHSSTLKLSRAPSLQLSEVSHPKSCTAKAPTAKACGKNINTQRPKTPVAKTPSAKTPDSKPAAKPIASKRTTPRASAAKTPGLKTPSAKSFAKTPVATTPKIAAAKASVETPVKASALVSLTAKTPFAKSDEKSSVSKTPKMSAAKVPEENLAKSLTPVLMTAKSLTPEAQSRTAPAIPACVTKSLPGRPAEVRVTPAKIPNLSYNSPKPPVSKTPSSLAQRSSVAKTTVAKASTPLTPKETPTSRKSLPIAEPKTPEPARTTPVSRSSRGKSLAGKTPTDSSIDAATSGERNQDSSLPPSGTANAQAVDPSGPISSVQAMPKISVPSTPQSIGIVPRVALLDLPPHTSSMSSAGKPPRGWSRGSPTGKDPMHSVVKTIAKSTKKRSKSIVFAPQIELEKGPHYSPRVSKHIPRTPQAYITPAKKVPEVSPRVQKRVPRRSPGARQNVEPNQRTRVAGRPPTSRLAALGTFFFPVLPGISLDSPSGSVADENNEFSDNMDDDRDHSSDTLEVSESSGSTQSPESEETTTSDEPLNLSLNLDRARHEPEDEFDIDSETDESTDGSGQAATSTAHTPVRRRSFSERLSGLFFGTPAPDAESPHEIVPGGGEAGTPVAAEAGRVNEELSETPTEEPEDGEESSDSEVSSSPSNASESEFLTVREEPVVEESTPRRKSLLGSAFSAVVAAVASPARNLFSRRVSLIKENTSSSPSASSVDDKMDEEEITSDSVLADQTPRSDLATVNSDTNSDEVEQNSGEQLHDTTSNLLDRFNIEAGDSHVAGTVSPQVKKTEEVLTTLADGKLQTATPTKESGKMETKASSEGKSAMNVEVLEANTAEDVDIGKSSSTMDGAVSEDTSVADADVDDGTKSVDVQVETTPKSLASEDVPASDVVEDPNAARAGTVSVEGEMDKPVSPVVNLVTPKKNPVPRTDYNAWKVKELHEYLSGINIPTSRTMRKAELVALAQKAEATAAGQKAMTVTDVEGNVDEAREEDVAQGVDAKVSSDPASWKMKELLDYLSGIDVPTSKTMRKAELVALVRKAEAVTVDKEEEAEQKEEGNIENDDVTAGVNAVTSREEIRELLMERKVPYLRDLLRKFGEDDKGRKADLIDTLLSKYFEKVMRSVGAEKGDDSVLAETSAVQDEAAHDAVEPDFEPMETENSISDKHEERKSELKAMTVKKLQVILGKLKLEKLGKKDVLVDRILSAEFCEPVVEDEEEKAKDDEINSSTSRPSRRASTLKKTGKVQSVKDEAVDVQRMTVAQLRKYLRENNSCSFGLKAVLVARAEQMQSGTRPKRKVKDNALCSQCQEGKLCAGPK